MSDSDSSDEYYGSLMRKALDVELPDDFDPKSIPQTGEEYLHHVIYERQNMKSWITVEIDRTKIKNELSFVIPKDDLQYPDSKFMPTAEWQNKKLIDFEEYRNFLQEHVLTEGHSYSFNSSKFLNRALNAPPTFSELIKYAPQPKMAMLEIIGQYLDTVETEINTNVATWIYGILSLVDIPLTGSVCHDLREFLRKCCVTRLRLSKKSTVESCVPLNLYICIIARCYGQKDLADPH